MGTLDVLEAPASMPNAERPEVINDFQIVIATVNGSGSQTANSLLARSAFKMGIPVGQKNMFPSNISGLPTWYAIRVSRDGYIARKDISEVTVAFNPATAEEDLANVPPGGVCIYPEEISFAQPRTDVHMYSVPARDIMKKAEIDPKLRDHVRNMVYVGALAHLLGIAPELLEQGLTVHFKGKQKPIQMNLGVVQLTLEWARDNLVKADPYKLEPLDMTKGKIIIDGNTAGALGTIFGGVQVAAWYPITPSTSMMDAVTSYLPMLRPPVDGKTDYAVIQAEDELAAIGMVLGAGWAGCRSMTSTAGPGISLMSEFTGLGYFAEVPGVIWDVQRVGPSTGLPTRTSQGDLLPTYYLGHGDARHVILLPHSMEECFEFGWRAFDLAEGLQTPVFVLSDLDLGMNNWMSEPFEYPTEPMNRGKVLTAEQLDQLGKFARYEDVDGDAIPYRTLPGNEHPLAPWFARGTGHNPQAVYSERPNDWEENLLRLERKHDTARTLVPKPEVDIRDGAEVGLICYGSASYAVNEARDAFRADGFETSFLRVRALPLEETLTDFVKRHKRVYVVELNIEGQLRQLIQLHIPERAADVRSVAHLDGLPLTAQYVRNAILEQEQN